MRKKTGPHGLTWYTFSIFEPHPELRHGVFTRHGGVSGPEGRDLHLSFSGGADPAGVRTNLRRAEDALGLPPAAFIGQTHSAHITVVRPEDEYHPRGPEDIRQGRDAMIAPKPGVNLLIRTADCQGVILYDPETRMLGLVHSGWRGSVQNILGVTVAHLADLGARPASIKAAIGPSLGPCCAEFVNHRQELPEHFQNFMTAENHFDFWAISRRQLTDSGLDPENIATAGVCTKCSPEFFSYRRGDWGRFGIMAGVLKG